MLDIVIPVHYRFANLVPDAIEKISSNTKCPFNLVVMLDGGLIGDYVELQEFMASIDHPWRLLHNNPSVGANQSIREGLEACNEKITAIIHPEVRIMDGSWFEKIQQIFHRDPITGIIDTAPNTKSATLYPVKRAHNRPPLPGCKFMIVQTSFAKKTALPDSDDPAVFWSRMASSNGGSAWHAGAVRYTEVVGVTG